MAFVFCAILQKFTISVKNVFSGLFFDKQKGTRVFQWQEDINVVVILSVLSTETYLSFLKFYFLGKIFGETLIMFVKSTSFPKELYKSLLSPEQNGSKEIQDTVLEMNKNWRW